MLNIDTNPQEFVRQRGVVIAEGKTKIIATVEGVLDALVISKDDITAGDGAKHDIIQGKAALATETTCNVFRLLKACGIPVAFTEQVNGTTFSAPICNMLPYEVVVRREAHGSYQDRHPEFPKGHLFPRLLLEFFLKTKDKKWKDFTLVKDDPLLNIRGGTMDLYFPGWSSEERKTAPKGALVGQKPFLTLQKYEVFSHANEEKLLEQMGVIARRVFLILEKAWQIEGRTLVDFKVEFGLSKDGALLLADVIDNDSWRVVENGAYIDKQVYRDGGNIDDVAEKYRRVAEITGHFRLPAQQVIVWRGSPNDNISPVLEALDHLCGDYSGAVNRCIRLTTITCSIHKEPVRGLNILHSLVQEVPNTVVIAYIGRSNGAGPTLSAATTVPVITVPASFEDFPEDVWSSLRTPSNVPVTTVLEPSNAAMAAIEILALRNPLLYMFLREQLEERLVNTIPV